MAMERVRTLVQVRYDLDGSTTVTAETTADRLIIADALPLFGELPAQPTPNEILRQTARATFRAAGRGTQSRAAEKLGVTRGELANFLSGRHVLNPPAQALLRSIVSGSDAA